MSHYIVDSTRKVSDSQRLVLAIPVAITMVFCFGYVAMVHPAKNNSDVSASSGSSSASSSADSLPPIPLNSEPASTLSTTNSSSATGTAPKTTAAPTTPKTSTPQSASQSHDDQPLKIRVGNKIIDR